MVLVVTSIPSRASFIISPVKISYKKIPLYYRNVSVGGKLGAIRSQVASEVDVEAPKKAVKESKKEKGVIVNKFKPEEPYIGTCLRNTRTTGAPGETWHAGEIPYKEGQSVGLIPEGVDKNGKPHKLRLYSTASSPLGDFGDFKTVSLLDKQSKDDIFFNNSTNLAATMLTLAENGYAEDAESLWDVLVNSSLIPTFHLVSSLVIAYAKTSNFNQISRVLTQIRDRKFSWLPQAYSLSISCFGIGGQLDLMEKTLNEMISMGFRVDSLTGNAYVVYYSKYGSLSEMEIAYGRLKKSQILIEEEAIRVVSLAYMNRKKFYKLGEFLREVGLGRKNVGNLLWNLLLLSYAVNFKMKSLQREFLGMVESGFKPDLTSFNIRALSFSRMNLFWDLHLSIEHMRHENVVPDLVTYGCVVDAYIEKRMVKNLDFALKKMVNLDEFPTLGTDPFVFEAMGKGDFHLASEAFLEFNNNNRRWTYRKLIQMYVRKRHRSTQIFWNY